LLPSADDSLRALAEAVDKHAQFLTSDGAADIDTAQMVGQLQIHVLQAVTLVALVEISLKSHQNVVLLDGVHDEVEVLGDHAVLEQVASLDQSYFCGFQRPLGL